MHYIYRTGCKLTCTSCKAYILSTKRFRRHQLNCWCCYLGTRTNERSTGSCGGHVFSGHFQGDWGHDIGKGCRTGPSRDGTCDDGNEEDEDDAGDDTHKSSRLSQSCTVSLIEQRLAQLRFARASAPFTITPFAVRISVFPFTSGAFSPTSSLAVCVRRTRSCCVCVSA